MTMQAKEAPIYFETRQFWHLSQDLRVAVARGLDLYEIIDELDVLSRYTDSEPLKTRCVDLMMKYAARANAQRPAARAGG
jgi:hypothetical protein